MKISKLFHWLYAILMLLPFAFFVPSVLYYAFNDNATMQTVEVPKTETISVDFNQNFNEEYDGGSVFGIDIAIDENLFELEGTFTNNVSSNLYATHFYGELNHKYLVRNGYVNEYVYFNQNGASITSFVGNDEILVCNSTSTPFFLYVNGGFNGSYVQYSKVINCFDLTKMFGVGNEPTISEFNEMFVGTYPYTESKLMQITYDTGETEQLVQNTDIVNYAWESIWNLPLFSWCKVSFVAVPFTYITGLFGLAPSNSFNYVFTYFASMSIIWLVFDVILYVPLLVHRWLDKGIVE